MFEDTIELYKINEEEFELTIEDSLGSASVIVTEEILLSILAIAKARFQAEEGL